MMSISWIVWSILLLGSCVLAPQTMVVERSKEEPPAWVELSPEKSQTGDLHIQFHSVMGREPDLPLGIKRAQSKALEGSERGVVRKVQEHLEEIGSQHDTSESTLKDSETETAVAEAVKKSHGAHAKIADIYYERHQPLAKDSSHPESLAKGDFYAIHVLVQYPREQIFQAVLEIGRNLQKSRNPDVKRLGGILMSQNSRLSH